MTTKSTVDDHDDPCDNHLGTDGTTPAVSTATAGASSFPPLTGGAHVDGNPAALNHSLLHDEGSCGHGHGAPMMRTPPETISSQTALHHPLDDADHPIDVMVSETEIPLNTPPHVDAPLSFDWQRPHHPLIRGAESQDCDTVHDEGEHDVIGTSSLLTDLRQRVRRLEAERLDREQDIEALKEHVQSLEEALQQLMATLTTHLDQPSHDQPSSPNPAVVVVPSDPASLGEFLVHGCGMPLADAHGKTNGQWVMDSTISKAMVFLESDAARGVVHGGEEFEVLRCIIDGGSKAVLTADCTHNDALSFQRTIAVILVHTAQDSFDGSGDFYGQHFSCLIVNGRHRTAHVFDTLGRWSDREAKRLIRAVFPGLDLLARPQSYKLRNHTGRLRQSGATCGAWTLWICFAYALNYRGCRGPTEDVDCAVLQDDATAFWRAVTR